MNQNCPDIDRLSDSGRKGWEGGEDQAREVDSIPWGNSGLHLFPASNSLATRVGLLAQLDWSPLVRRVTSTVHSKKRNWVSVVVPSWAEMGIL
ncbi:hypothetical protein RRG08_060995 [Elysia crispata]|uniref:Uncharacterized protein n=1 Tax=Elysia crispata TaxID=231223 RepID=A0AAE1E5I8_9GAST|nr:hypothetical protein RRG08_060995 [Elysia crispata]